MNTSRTCSNRRELKSFWRIRSSSCLNMIVCKRVDGYPSVVFGDEDYLAEYLHELARSILVAPADGTEIKLEVRHELVVNLPQGDVRHFIFHFHKFFQPAVSPVIFHQRSRSLADAVQFGSVLCCLTSYPRNALRTFSAVTNESRDSTYR